MTTTDTAQASPGRVPDLDRPMEQDEPAPGDIRTMATAGAVERDRAGIAAAHDRVEFLTTQLADQLETLEHRLEPVMRPMAEPPGRIGGEKRAQNDSPVAERLYDVGDRLGDVLARLGAIAARVDL